MTLQLHRRPLRLWLLGGLVLWLLNSWVLYAFFYLIRESFRVIGTMSSRPLLTLEADDRFFYNLFLAAMASAIGFLFSLTFILPVLGSAASPGNTRARILRRRTRNEAGLYGWVVLEWFAKVGLVLGILYMTMELEFYLNFLKDYPLLLLLLPLVTFLAPWTRLRAWLPKAGYQSLAVLFSLFLGISLALASVELINVKAVERVVMPGWQRAGLSLPYSNTQHTLGRKQFPVFLYVTPGTKPGEEPTIYVDDITLKPHEISEYVNHQVTSFYTGAELSALLYLDRRLPMAYVQKLRRKLMENNFKQALYVTTNPRLPYKPSSLSRYQYQGLSQRWLNADSLQRVTKSVIRLSIEPKVVYLNDQPVSLSKLREAYRRQLRRQQTYPLTLVEVDERVSYEYYIAVLDKLQFEVDKLRNKESELLFNEAYANLTSSYALDTLSQLYPSPFLK